MANDTLVVTGTFNDQISPALKSIESGIIRIVGAFSALTSAATVLASPILMAAEFQKQMLEVKKTTDYTTAATASLARGLVDLSKNVNVTANDLAKIAAMGGQLGIGDAGAGALLTFTEEIARAVTALDVNAELASTSLGKLINIFNIDPAQYRNVIGVINQISNVSTARPEELFDILRRIGSLGGSVSIDQATALSAVMIDLGLTAETAGTSITKVFADMKASAGDFANFVGMSTNEWSQLVESDGIAALKLYLNTLNKMPPAIAAATKAQLTGEGRIFGLITKLQEEQAKGGGLLDKRLTEASNEMQVGTSALKEQQSVLTGLSAQWQIFKNRVSSLFLAAGEQTLSPLTIAVKSLGTALSDEKAIASFISAGKSIVEIITRISEAIVKVVSLLGSLGIDWGRAFGLAAMLGVVGAIRGVVAMYATLATASKKSAVETAAAGAGQANVLSPLKLVSQMLTTTAEKWAGVAVAARLSTATQIAEANRLNVARRVASVQEALPDYRQQANAYYARNIRSLTTSVIAGTATAAEAAQFKQRLENYQRMITTMNEISMGRVGVETVVQNGITNVNNAALRRRLTAFEGAIASERAALASLATVQAGAQTAYSAGVPQIAPNAPGLMARMADAIRAVTSQGLGVYFAAATGKAELLAVATSRVQRAFIVAASAATLLSRAMGAILGFALRWIGIVAVIGTIAVSLLDMLGLLDKVKDGIWAVLKLFGMKTRPEFLGSKETEAEAARQQKLYEDMAAEKQKFEQRFGSIHIPVALEVNGQEKFDASMAKVMARVREVINTLSPKLTFRLDQPDAAVAAAGDMLAVIDAIRSGYRTTQAEVEKAKASEIALQQTVDSTRAAFERKNAEVAKISAAGSSVPQGMMNDLLQLKEKADTAAISLKNVLDAGGVAKGESVAFRQIQEARRATEEFISFLDTESALDLFGPAVGSADSYIVLLQKIGQKQAALRDEAKEFQITDLSAPLDTTGKSEAEVARIRQIQNEYETSLAKAIELKNTLYNLPSLDKVFPNKQVKVTFLDKLIAKAQEVSRAVQDAARVSNRSLLDLAKGTGTQTLPQGTTKDTVAANIAIALEAKRAAETMATVFKAKAEDAKNALAKALDASRQRLAEFSDFASRLARNMTGLQDKAAAQVKTRAIDDGTATRQSGLAATKALENDILNMIKEEGYVNQADIANRLAGLERARVFAQDQLSAMFLTGKISKETFDRETKALTDNISMQREMLGYYYDRTGITKEEAAAIQSVLDLKYKVSERAIVDQAEAQKSTVALDAISVSFTRLQASAAKSAAELQFVGAELAKGVSGNEAVALLKRRDDAQLALSSSLNLMRQEAEKFSNVDPVAGKILISPEEVQRMQDTVKRFTDVQNSVATTTAKLDEGIYTKQSNAAAGAVAGIQAYIDVQSNAATALKMSTDELAKYIALARELPAVQEKIAAVNKGVADLSGGIIPKVDKASIQQQLDEITATTTGITIPVNISPNNDAFTRAAEDMRGALTTGIAAAAEATKTAPIVVDAKLNIVATSGEVTVQVAGQRRDGGLIQAFASGGDVRGAGTGRSDSILSWLSHGEYVMDATTVRMLGSGFFRTLQGMAQRGTNLSGIRASMGAFASGGPIQMPSMAALAPNGLLQSIANPGGDTMNVDLSLNGGKRSRLRGARDQVESFVSALREVEKGMAR